jgi:hypothetical protein
VKFHVVDEQGRYFTPQGGWSLNPERAAELSPARAIAVARLESAAAIAVPFFVEIAGRAA